MNKNINKNINWIEELENLKQNAFVRIIVYVFKMLKNKIKEKKDGKLIK